MDELIQQLQSLLATTNEIDWQIVRHLADSCRPMADVSFSISTVSDRPDRPILPSQGFVRLDSRYDPDIAIAYFVPLVKDHKENVPALGTLFVLLSRLNFDDEQIAEVFSQFAEQVPQPLRLEIYDTLIASLNEIYFSHLRIAKDKPEDTAQWLTIFQSAQYHHSIGDPLWSVLQLMREDDSRIIPFRLIKNMKPLLRAILISYYGMELQLGPTDLATSEAEPAELAFLCAVLLQTYLPEKAPPDWMSRELIIRFLAHWSTIGQTFFRHVFGLSFRNTYKNPVYQQLSHLLHDIIAPLIQTEVIPPTSWVSKLSYPRDFIALFAYFHEYNIGSDDLSISCKRILVTRSLEEWQGSFIGAIDGFGRKNGYDPFLAYQFYENKYRIAMAWMLLLLIDPAVFPNVKKPLRDLLYDAKLFFYGGYQSTHLALQFGELLFLTAFSGFCLTKLEAAEGRNLAELLKLLSDTFMVPFVHLAEREEEIWNSRYERVPTGIPNALQLLNVAMVKTLKHVNSSFYEPFFRNMAEVKIAEWPYERTIKGL
jgi:hypothetical protein